MFLIYLFFFIFSFNSFFACDSSLELSDSSLEGSDSSLELSRQEQVNMFGINLEVWNSVISFLNKNIDKKNINTLGCILRQAHKQLTFFKNEQQLFYGLSCINELKSESNKLLYEIKTDITLFSYKKIERYEKLGKNKKFQFSIFSNDYATCLKKIIDRFYYLYSRFDERL